MDILVFRLSSLGDVVLLGGVLGKLKAAHPSAKISVVVKPAYADVVRNQLAVSEVIEWKGFFATLTRLKSRHWDISLDLHAVLRTRLLACFVPAARKITYDKAVCERYRLLWRKGVQAGTHVTERYERALLSLGVGVRRIVVLQTAFMGDAVLTVPALRRLKERFAPEVLDVVVRPEFAGLLQREGFSVIEDDKRGKTKGIAGFFTMLRTLKNGRYDLALGAQRSWRTSLLAYLAGIPVRVGFASAGGAFLWTKQVPFVWSEHDSDRNIRLVEALGAPRAPGADGSPWRLSLGGHEAAHAKEIYRENGFDVDNDFIVGMAAGSVWPTKRWPAERFAALAAALHAWQPPSPEARGTLDPPEAGPRQPRCRVALMGGPAERAVSARIAALSKVEVVDLCGRLSIGELPAVIAGMKLFISNDSGPMHIAWGLGVPTVAIFGPTVKGFGFYPKGAHARVVEVGDLRCRPCGLHGSKRCPHGHFLCMELIGVESVLAACKEAVAAI